MKWIELNNVSQLDEIDQASQTAKVLLFKHSTRCSISDTALTRFNRDWKEGVAEVKTYYLDLIKHRDISNAIEQRYGIRHESPQVLIIDKGKCIYSETHLSIQVPEILDKL